MPTFNNMKDLYAHVQNAIEKVLEPYVATAVKKVEQEMIIKTVYDVYSGVISGKKRPVKYKRRRDDGGLMDIDNMQSDVKNGVLTIKNITEPNDSYKTSMFFFQDLAEIIEYGDGYNGFSYDYDTDTDDLYKQARPFTKNTVRRLKDTGRHIQALKKGLKKLKIDTN